MSAISTPITPSNRRRMAPLIALGAVVLFAAAWFLVLHKHGSSSGSAASSTAGSTPATTTPGAAPATATPAQATGTPAPSAHAAAKPAHHAPAHLSDPFGRHLSTPSTSSTGSPSSTASPSSSASASPTPTASPSPAASQPSTPVSSNPSPATSTGGAPSASSPTTATPVSNTGTLTAEPTTSTPTAAPVTPWRVYRADVRVTPAKSTVRRRLARLAPLADAQVPFALYLGAVRGGKRVAFLLNRDATVSGSARCAPFHRGYRTLYLKAHQAVHVSIPFLGTTMTYRLGVMHLTGRRVSTAHAARVANHRVSKPGRTMLRRYGLLKWTRFSTERGVVPPPKHLKSCV
jgi:hypothetical protein